MHQKMPYLCTELFLDAYICVLNASLAFGALSLCPSLAAAQPSAKYTQTFAYPVIAPYTHPPTRAVIFHLSSDHCVRTPSHHMASLARIPTTMRGTCIAARSRALLLRASPLSQSLPAKRSFQTVATPLLVDLEKRWPKMSLEEKDELRALLQERQNGPWNELTKAEKRAAYYIAFGAHGPRTIIHGPGFYKKVFFGTALALSVALSIFGTIRYFAPPLPESLSREWEEESQRRMIEMGVEPISGPNLIQSKK